MKFDSRYVMHDQVRGLVPDLMRFDPQGERRLKNAFGELLLFALATLTYLFALGFSN